MTRGKLIYIGNDDVIYETVEFNGDMYPNGHGEDIISEFENGYFENVEEYDRFVKELNRRHFGYEEELIHTYYAKEQGVIDVTNNWTDYLYIINESSREVVIKAKDSAEFLYPRSIGIVRYQHFEKEIHRVIREEKGVEISLISKEEFVQIINGLQRTKDFIQGLDAIIGAYCGRTREETSNGADILFKHKNDVLLLLKKLMKDKHLWIDYYINGIDFGRNYKDGMAKDKFGRNVDLSSAEKLYELITNSN